MKSMLSSSPLVAGLFGLAIWLLPICAAHAQVQTQADLDRPWNDLASREENRASRALLTLAASPRETIAFLKEKLKPVKADAAQVAALVSQLDSSNFAVRQQAMRELEYLGKSIRADLEKALKSKTSAETKMRLEQLLDQMPREAKAPVLPQPKFRPGSSIAVSSVNGQVQIIIDGVPLDLTKMQAPLPAPPGPPLAWIRAERAVALLEHFGTPEALQILQALAGGEADALPTRAARETLDRLKK